MTRNDTFFKILFAIEIALLPLVMAAYILMPTWTVGLFVAAVLIAKIWIELFKNKEDKTHIIINAIGNTLTISALTIFFAIYGYVNVTVCVFIVILAIVMNILKVCLNGKMMPEIIDAVDSCYMLFECLLLGAYTFVIFYQLVTNIALFALLLTSAVSIAYKLFYIFKHYGVWATIKNFFAKLIRRK